jgi:hypothetical protein
VRFLTDEDKAKLCEGMQETGVDAFDYRLVINCIAALAKSPAEDPYYNVWFGQVRGFYEVIQPGCESKPTNQWSYLHVADVDWFKWPERY